MPTPGWPTRLSAGDVALRPIRLADAAPWAEIRRRDQERLRPWESTPPGGGYSFSASTATFLVMLRELRSEARRGTALPFAVTFGGGFAGQLTIGNVVRGALNSGVAGYWLDSRVWGREVMPTALALVVDHCFEVVGLHRIEVNIRPENAQSRRVMGKLGFREEGLRQRLLYIAGDYRDHVSYALVREDVPRGLLPRWRQRRRPA